MDENGYDEATCVTAGELRAMGVPVPEKIPDCGWVPTHAVRWGPPNASMEGDTVFVELGVSFLEDFRWVELTYTIGEEKA
jgi:hypothetical protein